MTGRRCAVVGPTRSAAARVAALADAGAFALHLGETAPTPDALAGSFLCMVTEDASDDVAARTSEAARAAGALAWCGDRPALSDFWLPAVLRSGALVVTVSTGGASPALAVRLRDALAELLAPIGPFVERLARARTEAKAVIGDAEARRDQLRRLVEAVRITGRVELPEDRDGDD